MFAVVTHDMCLWLVVKKTCYIEDPFGGTNLRVLSFQRP